MRKPSVSIQNNFSRGLITQATGLNFPENACTDTDNCIFTTLGSVHRRRGIDYEYAFSNKTINRTNLAVKIYLWKNVNGDGNTTLLVLQVGTSLYFYDTTSSTSISAGALSGTVDLTSATLAPGGSPPSPGLNECQFAAGLGYLFVVHPYLEPFSIKYTAPNTFSVSKISIKIRDLEGIVEEGVLNTSRPISLTDNHAYNLGNQGWQTVYRINSSTSNTIGTGNKTFTITDSVPIVVGDIVRIYSNSAPTTNFMIGVVTAYTASTSLSVNVTSTGGSGTATDWRITQYPDNRLTWNAALGNFPSNSDVWWLYKNSSDVFAPSTTFVNNVVANYPAPKGHFILDAFNQNRSTVSGISNLLSISTDPNRPSCVAFHAGRVFYSGVNYAGHSSKIYFTQIIDTTQQTSTQFGDCYQKNDPTSEDAFDLLPSDGGVIAIADCGTIYNLVSIQGALLVFASNGVWSITGSTGIGFAATDYSVFPIAKVKTLSATSFVDVLGYPMWWNAEGIYYIQLTQDNKLSVVSLTDGTIRDFYADIPLSSKRMARGYYEPIQGIIQWIYKSDDPSDLTDTYFFDRALNFNVHTKAWYPWSFGESTPCINAIFVAEGQGGSVSQNTVIRGADNVVDSSGNQVITFTLSDSLIQSSFKYIVSRSSAGSHIFTVGDCDTNDSYTDWLTFDAEGVNFNSYFVTGYMLKSELQRKFQDNYTYVFSDNSEQTSYKIRGMKNWSNTGSSAKWSTVATVNFAEDERFDVVFRKHKLRGTGLAAQYRVDSVDGMPFHIIGWSSFETGNALP